MVKLMNEFIEKNPDSIQSKKVRSGIKTYADKNPIFFSITQLIFGRWDNLEVKMDTIFGDIELLYEKDKLEDNKWHLLESKRAYLIPRANRALIEWMDKPEEGGAIWL